MQTSAPEAARPFNPVALVMLAALAVLIFGGQFAWDTWGPGENAGASASAGPGERLADPRTSQGETR